MKHYLQTKAFFCANMTVRLHGRLRVGVVTAVYTEAVMLSFVLLSSSTVALNIISYPPSLQKRARKGMPRTASQERRLWYGFLRKHPCPFTRQKPIAHKIITSHLKSNIHAVVNSIA